MTALLLSAGPRHGLLLLAVPVVPYLAAGLWRLTLTNPDMYGLLDRFLPTLNLAWMALRLAVVLLAVLARRYLAGPAPGWPSRSTSSAVP